MYIARLNSTGSMCSFAASWTLVGAGSDATKLALRASCTRSGVVGAIQHGCGRFKYVVCVFCNFVVGRRELL
jgi:hypothetical protein